MGAKKFFYVCAGILLLVITYSVGAGRVQSQSPPTNIPAAMIYSTAGVGGAPFSAVLTAVVITSQGDVFMKNDDVNNQVWRSVGNAFNGSPPGRVVGLDYANRYLTILFEYGDVYNLTDR